jgi:hypothetical protein
VKHPFSSRWAYDCRRALESLREGEVMADGDLRGSRMKRFVLIGLLVVVLGAVSWTWASLSWAYSTGDRAGVLLKFSKKGWLCKTYEGQLAMYIVGGVAPQLWEFSTRDEELAKKLSAAVGREIQVHYSEHRGVPTNCFAETPYFADGFTLMDRK